MKIEYWVKIGEVVKTCTLLQRGLYARYAVMEYISANGDREYKQVLMCTWSESENVQSQPEVDDVILRVREIDKDRFKPNPNKSYSI